MIAAVDMAMTISAFMFGIHINIFDDATWGAVASIPNESNGCWI